MNIKFVVGTAAVVGALTALAVTAVIKKRKQLDYEDFEDIDFDEIDDDVDCYGDVEVDVKIPDDLAEDDDTCDCCVDGTCNCQDKSEKEDKK